MQNMARPITISKEASCPCGSGKSFNECCENKKHTYESLIVDEMGSSIIYDQTEIISAVKNLNTFISNRISSETSNLAQSDALRKLKRLYEKLGEALKPMWASASCKEGCGQCCHLLVLTSQLEAQMIKEFIFSHYSEEKLKELTDKLNEHKDILNNISVNKDGSFSEESTKNYLSSKIPCAFLDENSRCMVYEARPFICRKYLVFNDPKVCSDLFSKTNQYYSGYHSTVKNAIIKLNQLAYGSNYKYKHLLCWFIEN